ATGISRETLADVVHVILDRSIIQNRQLLFSLCGRLLPDLNVVLRGKEIPTRLDIRLGVGDAGRQHECDEQRKRRTRDELRTSIHGTSSFVRWRTMHPR